jgi:hypothetical protein
VRADALNRLIHRESVSSRRCHPSHSAEVVGHALTARRPRTRYVVGREARVQAVLARLLPDRAFDALVRRALT